MVVDVASPSSAATPLSSKRAHDELEDTGETADDGGSSYGPVTPAKRVHVEVRRLRKRPLHFCVC